MVGGSAVQQKHDPLKILKLIEAAKGQRLAKSKSKEGAAGAVVGGET